MRHDGCLRMIQNGCKSCVFAARLSTCVFVFVVRAPSEVSMEKRRKCWIEHRQMSHSGKVNRMHAPVCMRTWCATCFCFDSNRIDTPKRTKWRHFCTRNTYTDCSLFEIYYEYPWSVLKGRWRIEKTWKRPTNINKHTKTEPNNTLWIRNRENDTQQCITTTLARRLFRICWHKTSTPAPEHTHTQNSHPICEHKHPTWFQARSCRKCIALKVILCSRNSDTVYGVRTRTSP